MTFIVKSLEQDVLCITVFDRDIFSPNGGILILRISCDSLLTGSVSKRSIPLPRKESESVNLNCQLGVDKVSQPPCRDSKVDFSSVGRLLKRWKLNLFMPLSGTQGIYKL